MKVSQLIDLLMTFDPTMEVAYSRYSEQCLLEADEIQVATLCEARPDGWIQNSRPDMPQQNYLLFPGN